MPAQNSSYDFSEYWAGQKMCELQKARIDIREGQFSGEKWLRKIAMQNVLFMNCYETYHIIRNQEENSVIPVTRYFNLWLFAQGENQLQNSIRLQYKRKQFNLWEKNSENFSKKKITRRIFKIGRNKRIIPINGQKSH